MGVPTIAAALSCTGALTEKRHVELPRPKAAPTCRNTFSVSHASKHPDAALAKGFLDERIPQQRMDMDAQRGAVRQHQQVKRREITESAERRNAIGAKEKVIGVKCLMRHAAEKSIRQAHAAQYCPMVIRFMRQTWQALLQQVHTYLGEPGASESPEDETQLIVARCRGALENISALGVWFAGAISIPFRRYSVRAPAEDGTLQDFVVIGLASFTYSSYVMDDRRLAQEATLAELERLSKRLGVSLLFLPPLVLPEERLRGSGGFARGEASAEQLVVV
ncbi:uncharacterized protein Tco025E_05827 [Trypanosoma conorhini]|uniref:Uncharacterized protein n=1 Tax=Trypanosoma conorhini TaxID=83891 RepID=A0A3R7KVX7_9TRYP|nr:uncharacterized protein Tco025E_05827 [Trypanosoma conorhini]RNF14457.1 hypothetical protein Tco025E_05827 [Trypanosoma conorhini]